MGFTTIPIIVMICTVFMSVIKLFTKDNKREDEIIATLVPCFGALLAVALYFINSKYTMSFDDPLVAFIIGFVSGQGALETKSTINYIKSKKELKEIITEPNILVEVKNEVINEIVTTEEVQDILNDNITKLPK